MENRIHDILTHEPLFISPISLPESQIVGQSSVEENRKKRNFEYFIVLDLEATCDNQAINPSFRNFFSFDFFIPNYISNFTKSKDPQEIIEFSSILVERKSLQIVDSIQIFVKPVIHPNLTPFCTELTGITQSIINEKGISLKEGLNTFDLWLKKWNLKVSKDSQNFIFVSWGNWDLNTMLPSQCKRMHLSISEYFNSWIDVRETFYSVCGKNPSYKGLIGALHQVHLTPVGKHHSGIDDCRNTVQILFHLISLGTDFTQVLLHYFDSSASSSNFKYCHCCIPCKKRVVKKVGINYGKAFFRYFYFQLETFILTVYFCLVVEIGHQKIKSLVTILSG